ncbi:hypothetical protein KIL84_007237 [Mauremys mutica]|uniref:Uncharacterized protein n=1 Tax=Mauremys mutica TaxID=74926 RepID=A0A9D3X0Q1_9SAUR|nr:hypothetical protein KIL84_007237 [Mauremys mutica]
MERSRRDLLLETLEQLEEEKLQRFEDKLSEIELKEEYRLIPLARLTHVDPSALTDLLLSSYGEDYGIEVAAGALRAVSQGDLAERLVVLTRAEITCEKVQPLSTAPLAEGATGGVEVNIREDSTAGQGRKDKCKLCPTEEDPPQEMNPEIVQGPDGNQETYRVHLPGAGSFRCSETELGFEVRAAVTVQYRYNSWDQHLREWSTPEWLVIGPLFNIRAEPATAVAAVHFPHVLCLAGGQADISQMRIAHFTDVGMTLEEPTGVRPFHAVLENPSFSLYGVIFICSGFLSIPVHSMMLIYQALRAADTTLHLYLIPNDGSLEKAIRKHEEKHQSVSVDKPPQTNGPLYFGTDYTVCCSPEAEITPKKLTFSYTSWENRQPFIEVFIEEMKRSVQLSVTESSSNEPRWEATLRPKDVKRDASSGEHHAGGGTGKTMRDHLLDTLKNLRKGELKEFKSKLTDIELEEGYDHIPRGHLESTEPVEILDLLVKHYGNDYAVKVTMMVLEAINQRALAERLRSAVRCSLKD